ncbi:hypothetical protein [Extensimonas sp. H3M7-6]|uniref:hypothetical protein n=1 Tax=Extensimonas soli TaxID=3031322 RepID=UPI0023DB394D|nr:hypothetical protein [Extensimonas sp. H3M7-6]MDF1481945.1 hypothetical protein [Extensimonas sp. H3M7-6]
MKKLGWFPRAAHAKDSCAETLAACRTLGVDSENAPQRDQFLPDSPPHSGTMGQEDGKKWAAAAHSQPTIPKSDRLPGLCDYSRAPWVCSSDKAFI